MIRQGTVLVYNRANAENVIDVGGAVVTNLPILSALRADRLVAGDVVALLVSGGGAAFIVGRVRRSAE